MRNTLTAIAKSSLLGALLVGTGSVLYAEKNLYLGVNGGVALFSPGLYSNREIKYKFDSLDSTIKTPSILYTVPVLGLNASLVLSETWIIGYSGSVARATGLDNPSQSKLELKKCGSLCHRCFDASYCP